METIKNRIKNYLLTLDVNKDHKNYPSIIMKDNSCWLFMSEPLYFRFEILKTKITVSNSDNSNILEIEITIEEFNKIYLNLRIVSEKIKELNEIFVLRELGEFYFGVDKESERKYLINYYKTILTSDVYNERNENSKFNFTLSSNGELRLFSSDPKLEKPMIECIQLTDSEQYEIKVLREQIIEKEEKLKSLKNNELVFKLYYYIKELC